VSEAALALNVSQNTLRRMISTGKLHAVKLGRAQGRTIRVPTSALPSRSRTV
jgi:excisionase family DNA binding protein